MTGRDQRLSDINRWMSPRRFVVAGLAAGIVFTGSFVVWGATAPISGAAIAPGAFVARGQNKLIQHLEGGTIATIEANEGQVVSAGDVIATLNIEKESADLKRLKQEYATALATEARQVAERANQEEIVYPEELLAMARTDASLATLMADQVEEFTAKRHSRMKEVSILQQKIKSLEAQIEGLEVQLGATKTQLDLFQQEIEKMQRLVDGGLTTHTHLYELKRDHAQLLGQNGELTASIAQAKETILENTRQIERLEVKGIEEAAKEIAKTRTQKAKLVKDMISTDDFIRRSVLRAPVDGTVVKLEFHTPGAVVSPGGTVAALLPVPADLVVEAKITLEDIDRVHPGQDAGVRIPALHIPYSPLLPAKVEYVSADRLYDETGEKYYYLARISSIELPQDLEGTRIYPGMQVESFIVTEPRTFFHYLVEPLYRSMEKSLREE